MYLDQAVVLMYVCMVGVLSVARGDKEALAKAKAVSMCVKGGGGG